MKKYLIIFALFYSMNALSQGKCEAMQNSTLTAIEAEYLSSYFEEEEEVKGIDFKTCKILFVTGSGGTIIGSKSEYFEYVREWAESNDKISTSVIRLNKQEKEQTGYDVIITYWVKVQINEKRKQKICKAVSMQ